MKKLIKFHEYAQRKKINVDSLNSQQITNICLSVGCEIPTELVLQKKQEEIKRREDLEVKVETVEMFQVIMPINIETSPQISLEENNLEVEVEHSDTDHGQENETVQEVDFLEENVSEQKSSILRKKRNQSKSN
jgi:hypothetical protein